MSIRDAAKAAIVAEEELNKAIRQQNAQKNLVNGVAVAERILGVPVEGVSARDHADTDGSGTVVRVEDTPGEFVYLKVTRGDRDDSLNVCSESGYRSIYPPEAAVRECHELGQTLLSSFTGTDATIKSLASLGRVLEQKDRWTQQWKAEYLKVTGKPYHEETP